MPGVKAKEALWINTMMGGLPQRGWWSFLASLLMWHQQYVTDLKRLVEDLLQPSSRFLLPDTELS